MDPTTLPGGYADTSPWISFEHLCPPRTKAERVAMTEMPSGVVLRHWRTHTQARLSFICAWTYPKQFFIAVPRHWPRVSVCCVIEDEMEDFGGIITVRSGRVRNLVKDYGGRYDGKAHTARGGKEAEQWRQLVREDRPYSLRPPNKLDGKVFDCDATFAPDDSLMYFRTEQERQRFRARYGGTLVRRPAGSA